MTSPGAERRARAVMAAGTELCPHCQRPFKRLRAHLPHCKARPAPAASPEPSPGTASTGPGPRAAPGSGRGAGPGSPRSRSRAVQDVARSLDLHPEEVEDVPKKLQKGVKVVIEKHRARVLREKEQPRSRAGAAGSGGEGTEPGPAPPPQRHKTAQKSKSKESRSQGAVGSGTGNAKGEKSSLKATKALQKPPENRNSPGGLLQQEGRDKFTAGEELEFGVGSKPPLAALHPKNLPLSLLEAFGGHGQGTSRTELSSPQRLQDSREGVQGVPELVLNPGRAPGLALLHTPQIQPHCSSQASGSSARGLEWVPDLYPDGEGLRIVPGERFYEDVRIVAETPKGGFTQGQRGNENLSAGSCWNGSWEGERRGWEC